MFQVCSSKSELKKVGGCQQKASHLRIKLHPVSNRFKYHFMICSSSMWYVTASIIGENKMRVPKYALEVCGV